MSAPRAKRALGQNFLIDPNLQRRIVEAVDPAPDDVVLEIGPGTGALTRHLAGRVARLIAIEKDDDLAAALREEFGDRIELIHGDALEAPLDDLPDRLKVVGNIPYNITTPLIFRILQDIRPASAVLMVQREVADRIVAAPGHKEYGALSVGVRAVADVERLFHVARGAFRPVPNVDSTVLRITPHHPPGLDADAERDLRSLTRATFSMRRKQLQKILRTAPAYGLAADAVEAVLQPLGIAPDARPEVLAPETFIALARALRQRGLPGDEPASAGPVEADSQPADGAVTADLPGHASVPVIAHELRSPVAAILGYAELLSDGLYGQVDDRAREGLGRIASAARQLRSLIDGLEILLGQGRPDIAPVDGVDVAEVVRDTIQDLATEAAMRGSPITVALEPVPALRTDPEALRRALQLLLGALLRSADGPTTVRVTALDAGAAILLPLANDAGYAGAALRRAMAARLIRALGGTLEEGASGVRVEVSAIDGPEAFP